MGNSTMRSSAPGAAMEPRQPNRPFIIDGLRIINEGLANWRIWHLLGTTELRQRYNRSRLGQVWLTLSTAITITALGSVWAFLWNQPVSTMMPWIGTSMILWAYISAIISECTKIFAIHGRYYLNQNMVLSVSIFSVIYKNTIMLLYNALIIFALIFIFDVPVGLDLLTLVPGLILTWLALLWLGYLLAMVCTRFRDASQIVDNTTQILFFITPVMWKPEFLPAQYRFIVDDNPVAIFLDLLRNPLLGLPVPFGEWLTALTVVVVGGVAALWLIGRYEHRVIYWA
jgi:ABC-type polysaccharide/polyol phosphate export permease